MNQDSINKNKLSQLGQYLSFELRGQIYAVPIENVVEINQVSEITPVPEAPEYINGVLNLRGKIIPIVDLGNKFGYNSTEFTSRTCIIVLETIHGLMGSIVDAVHDVIDIEPKLIEDANNFSSEIAKDYVAGLAKFEEKVFILLNLNEVLDQSDISTSARIETEAAS